MKAFITFVLSSISLAAICQSSSDMNEAASKFVTQHNLLSTQYEKQEYHLEMMGLMEIHEAIENIIEAYRPEQLDTCTTIAYQHWTELHQYIEDYEETLSEDEMLLPSTYLNLQKGIEAVSIVGLRRIQKHCPDTYQKEKAKNDAIEAIVQQKWNDEISSLKQNLEIFTQTTHAIKNMNSSLKSLNSYKGASTFRYSSNQLFDSNEDKRLNQYNFLIGLKLDKSIYPGEFSFNGIIGLNVNGNQFDESVSNINFSYDHDISSTKNPLRRELFGFVSRSSNTYLNLTQRYEVGGGLIINFFSNRISQKGQSIASKYTALDELDFIGGQIKACSDMACSLYPTLTSIDSSDIAAIKALHQKMINTNRKRFARWRGGMLMGLTLEFEEFNLPGQVSLTRLTDESDRIIINTPVKFDPTSIARIELRPFIEGNFNDKFVFKLKPYIFLPANLAKLQVTTQDQYSQDVKRWDIRYFIQGSISVNADPVSVSFGMSYNDDRYPRNFTYLDPTGEYGVFFENPKSHLLTTISFRYAFK